MVKKLHNPSDFLKLFASKEYLEFWVNVWKESDRGTVLLTTAFFDTQLGFLHLTHLREHIRDSEATYKKLVSRYGPLADFASKIQLGYAYGLLDAETHAELEKLRKIRNEVAHELTRFSFDDSEALKRVLELKKVPMEELFKEYKACGISASGIDAVEKYWLSQKKLFESHKQKPREHFMVFAMTMSARLMVLTLKTSRRAMESLEKKLQETREMIKNTKTGNASTA